MYKSESGLELLASLPPPQESWDDRCVQPHLPIKTSQPASSLTDEEPGAEKVGSLCEVTQPWESTMWHPEATSDPISQGGLPRTLGVLGANKIPVCTHTNPIRAWGWVSSGIYLWDKLPSEGDSLCLLGFLEHLHISKACLLPAQPSLSRASLLGGWMCNYPDGSAQ